MDDEIRKAEFLPDAPDVTTARRRQPTRGPPSGHRKAICELNPDCRRPLCKPTGAATGKDRHERVGTSGSDG